MPVREESYMEQQKQRILAAAFVCFSEKGYQKTSMRAIAREAGLAVGTLYIHFQNRKDILTAMKAIGTPNIDQLQFASWDEFKRYLVAIVDCEANPEAKKFIITDLKLASEALGNDELFSMFQARIADSLVWISEHVAKFEREGAVKLRLGVAETANILRYLLNGALTAYAFESENDRPAKEVLLDTLNILEISN